MIMLLPASFSFTHIAAALATIALTSVCLAIAKTFRRKLRIERGLAPVPGPRGVFLLGMLPEIAKNHARLHDFQEELMRQFGGRMKLPWSIFSDSMLYLADPIDVEHILSTNFSNYIRSQHLIECVGRVFDKSFLGLNHAHTADNGAMLQIQRKVGVKVFTTRNFKLFTEEILLKYAKQMVTIIDSQSGTCDMYEISSQYTLQAIFDIACGVPLKEVDPKLGLSFMDAMDEVFKQVGDRIITKPYFKYFFWCMPSEYKMKRNEQVMMDLADGILSKRLQESDGEIAKRSDIMSLFVRKARELEGGEGASVLDIETLRSIFLSFIFAGRDTTSSAITYAFYALAQYPEIQQKVFEEIVEFFDTKTPITYDDVKKLKYLDAVVMETMRLYPTVPFNMKYAVKDDYLPDGTFVPAGTEVIYNTFYMSRNNAKLWGGDPLVFRPERWLEMQTRPTAYEFPVFQGGPRICIGMNLGLLETKLFVAVLLRQFSVKIQENEQVENRGYILSPTLVMRGGLPLQMTRRITSVY